EGELTEVVTHGELPSLMPSDRLRAPAENDIQGIGAVTFQEDGLPCGELGERRAPHELAEPTPTEAGEERERREHVSPISDAAAVVVYRVNPHQSQNFEAVHAALPCAARCANGWWKASSARSRRTRKLIVSSVAS